MIANQIEFDKATKFLNRVTYFISALVLTLSLSFFFNLKGEAFFVFCGLYLSSEALLKMAHFFSLLIRHKISDKTEIVIENHKKYKVKYFNVISIVKYYYKGKLHRENGEPAVFRVIEDGSIIEKEWFFLGKKVSKEDITKLSIKNKVNHFK
jgi:hypothetical protein